MVETWIPRTPSEKRIFASKTRIFPSDPVASGPFLAVRKRPGPFFKTAPFFAVRGNFGIVRNSNSCHALFSKKCLSPHTNIIGISLGILWPNLSWTKCMLGRYTISDSMSYICRLFRTRHQQKSNRSGEWKKNIYLYHVGSKSRPHISTMWSEDTFLWLQVQKQKKTCPS